MVLNLISIGQPHRCLRVGRSNFSSLTQSDTWLAPPTTSVPRRWEGRKRDAASETEVFYSIQSVGNRRCNITGVTARIEQDTGVWAKSTPTLRAKVYKSQNLTDIGSIRSNGIAG